MEGKTYFESPENFGDFLQLDDIQKKIYSDDLLMKLAEIENQHYKKVQKIMEIMYQLSLPSLFRSFNASSSLDCAP